MDRCKVLNNQHDEGLAFQLSQSSVVNGCTPPFVPTPEQQRITEISKSVLRATDNDAALPDRHHHMDKVLKVTPALEVEMNMLMVLCDTSLDIPSHAKVIAEHTSRLMGRDVDLLLVEEILRKYEAQKFLSVRFNEGFAGLYVGSLDLLKLSIYLQDLTRKCKSERDDERKNKTVSGSHSGSIKLNPQQQYLMESIKSQEESILQGFCQHESREECHKLRPEGTSCKHQHFRKTTQKHSNDEPVSDCSLLNSCFNMNSGKNYSDMAANTGETTHQNMNADSVHQLHHVSDWYCDYVTNSSLAAVYPGHRQELANRPYSSEPYEITSVMDTSHIAVQSLPAHAATRKIDSIRSYLSNSARSNIVNDLPQSSGINLERIMPVTAFPASGIPNITPGVISSTHPAENTANILNSLTRPYIPMTESDVSIPQSSLLSEMEGTPFPCPVISYTFAQPPPVPSAPAVASTTFTEVSDVPSFDMTGPVMSYPWTIAGDHFQTNISSVESKAPSKTLKSKSNNGGEKRRCRRPELWKKNVTKNKKLKGEEHVSRTGSLIPAKQVFEVDCSNCTFKCHENFSEGLRQEIFKLFYSLSSNESQKQFVCQNVQESATKAPNAIKKDGAAENKRKVCRKYFLPDTDNTRMQVCSKFFCRTLAVGKTFITHALRNKQFGCYVGKEKRGKPHNKIPDVKLEPARQHIISLLSDSSTSPKKVSKKKCVEKGLNIAKMYEMYKQDCTTKNAQAISLSMYRRIFHTEF